MHASVYIALICLISFVYAASVVPGQSILIWGLQNDHELEVDDAGVTICGTRPLFLRMTSEIVLNITEIKSLRHYEQLTTFSNPDINDILLYTPHMIQTYNFATAPVGTMIRAEYKTGLARQEVDKELTMFAELFANHGNNETLRAAHPKSGMTQFKIPQFIQTNHVNKFAANVAYYFQPNWTTPINFTHVVDKFALKRALNPLYPHFVTSIETPDTDPTELIAEHIHVDYSPKLYGKQFRARISQVYALSPGHKYKIVGDSHANGEMMLQGPCIYNEAGIATQCDATQFLILTAGKYTMRKKTLTIPREDTQIILANVSRSIQSGGMHKTISTSYSFDKPASVKASDQCALIVTEMLTEDYFVNHYELDERERIEKNNEVIDCSAEMDLEKSASQSSQHLVLVTKNLTLQEMKNARTQITINLPIHLRYNSPSHLQEAVESAIPGQVMLTLECSDGADRKKIQQWHVLPHYQEGSGRLRTIMPVGQMKDFGLITKLTALVLFSAVGLLFFFACTGQPPMAQSTEKKNQ